MNRSKKNPLSCGVFFLIFCSFLLSTAVTAGALERVPWSRLAYHLESRQVKLLDLPTCDCPLGINEDAPSHQVIQVIGNTFYEWREYTFTNSKGETRLAIEMLQPESRYLTAKEARILLTASAGWQRMPEKTVETTAIPTRTRQSLMPGTPARQATNQDSWMPIPTESVTAFPYRTIANFFYLQDDSFYLSTCFLVAPRCALTAGHDLQYNNQVTSEGMVTPAQFVADNQIAKPFNHRKSDSLYVNTRFDPYDFSQPSEYDFGAVYLYYPFDDMGDTFMPIEYHRPGTPLPDRVTVVAYPTNPYGTVSYEMWQTEVWARLNSQNDSIIDIGPFSVAGASGAPILSVNTLGQARVIGLVTWEDSGFNSGVLFSDRNKNLVEALINTNPTTFSHTYYLPYFVTRDSNWTGVALCDYSDDSDSIVSNYIQFDFFTPDGELFRSNYIELRPRGQLAAPINDTGNQHTGWLRISSTRPLYGLALVGNTGPSTMFDMDIQEKLHKRFLFPHLAATTAWDSTAMLCNPNDSPASLTFTYFAPDGTPEEPIISRIPAHGSIAENLGALFGHPLENGSMVLSSSQPLAAFLLYDGTKANNNWKAGLSAVPLD